MQDNLDLCIKERIYHLKIFCEKLNLSKEILFSKTKDKKSRSILIHEKAMEKIKQAEKIFKIEIDNKNLNKAGEKFIRIIEKKIDRAEKKYISVIQSLESYDCEKGTHWLFDIEKKIINKLLI
jgi:UDP-N-acetylglucosamine/UDP-N-acetylgalactosamine diphosphorylase